MSNAEQPTFDVDWEARQIERQRERALAGGARYGRGRATTADRDCKPDRECRNCGSHIVPQTARVLGDNQNRVWACPRCVDHDEIYRGAAAGQDTTKEGL